MCAILFIYLFFASPMTPHVGLSSSFVSLKTCKQIKDLNSVQFKALHPSNNQHMESVLQSDKTARSNSDSSDSVCFDSYKPNNSEVSLFSLKPKLKTKPATEDDIERCRQQGCLCRHRNQAASFTEHVETEQRRRTR